MQPLRLWDYVLLQVGACSLEECIELCVVTQSVPCPVIFKYTQQSVATTVKHASQSAVRVAVIQDILTYLDPHVAHATDATLLSQ